MRKDSPERASLQDADTADRLKDPNAKLWNVLDRSKNLLWWHWRLNGESSSRTSHALLECSSLASRAGEAMVKSELQTLRDRLELLEKIDKAQNVLSEFSQAGKVRHSSQPRAAVASLWSWGTPWSDQEQEASWALSASILLVFLVALCFYSNSIRGEATFDDVVALSGNPDVLGTTAWTELLYHDSWGNSLGGHVWTHKSYRPLTVFTLRLQYMFWGLPRCLEPYHIVNLALHAVASALVLLVLRSWGAPLRVCALVGMIFASHPVHVEAVSNVSGRAELLSALWSFGTALLVGSKELQTLRGKAAAFVLAAAAMVSKETGLMILPFLVLRELLPIVRSIKSCSVAEVLVPAIKHSPSPYLSGAFVVLAAVRFCLSGGTKFEMHTSCARVSTLIYAYQRLVAVAFLQTQALMLCLWPDVVGMAHNHHGMDVVENLMDGRNAVTFAVHAAFWGCFLASFERYRRTTHQAWKVLVLSFCWFLCFYAPASHAFFPVGLLIADRVMYLPSLGVYAIAASALDMAVLQAKKLSALQNTRVRIWLNGIVYSCLGILLVLNGARTRQRNQAWSSQMALFHETLLVYPNDAQTRFGIAAEHWSQFKAHGGLQSLQKSGKRREELQREAPMLHRHLTFALGNASAAVSKDEALGEARFLLCRMRYELAEYSECVNDCARAFDGGTREASFMMSVCQLFLGEAPSKTRLGYFAALEGNMIQSSIQRPRLLNGAAIAAVSDVFFSNTSDAVEFPLSQAYPTAPDPRWAISKFTEAIVLYENLNDGDVGLELEMLHVKQNLIIVLAQSDRWDDAGDHVHEMLQLLAKIRKNSDSAPWSQLQVAGSRADQLQRAIGSRNAAADILRSSSLWLITLS